MIRSFIKFNESSNKYTDNNFKYLYDIIKDHFIELEDDHSITYKTYIGKDDGDTIILIGFNKKFDSVKHEKYFTSYNHDSYEKFINDQSTMMHEVNKSVQKLILMEGNINLIRKKIINTPEMNTSKNDLIIEYRLSIDIN